MRYLVGLGDGFLRGRGKGERPSHVRTSASMCTGANGDLWMYGGYSMAVTDGNTGLSLPSSLHSLSHTPSLSFLSPSPLFLIPPLAPLPPSIKQNKIIIISNFSLK
jgi:hypothetical protein